MAPLHVRENLDSFPELFTAGLTAVGVLVALVLALILCSRKSQSRGHEPPPLDWAPFMLLLESMFNESVAESPKYPNEINRARYVTRHQYGVSDCIEVNEAELEQGDDVPLLEGSDSVVTMKATVSTGHRESTPAEDITDELLLEAVVTAQFDHKNVISLIGVITTGEPMCLFFQNCMQGPLQEVLKARGELEMDNLDRLLFAKGIASGMEHLHSKGYIHKDLCSRTVLLDSRHNPVIADLCPARLSTPMASGRFRSTADYRPITEADHDLVFAVAWTAPEVLDDEEHSEKSDVFAFGITLHEIFGNGANPFGSLPHDDIEMQIMQGTPPSKPSACPTSVYSLIKRCVKLDPEDRPTFIALKKEVTIICNKHERKNAASKWISGVTGSTARGSKFRASRPLPMSPSHSLQSPGVIAARVSNAGDVDAYTTHNSPGGSVQIDKHDYVRRVDMPTEGAQPTLYAQTNTKVATIDDQSTGEDAKHNVVDDTTKVEEVALLQSSGFKVNWDNRQIRESVHTNNEVIRTNTSNYGNLTTTRLLIGRGRVNLTDGEEYTMVLLHPETVSAMEDQAAEVPIPREDLDQFQNFVRSSIATHEGQKFTCVTCKALFTSQHSLIKHQKLAHPSALSEMDTGDDELWKGEGEYGSKIVDMRLEDSLTMEHEESTQSREDPPLLAEIEPEYNGDASTSGTPLTSAIPGQPSWDSESNYGRSLGSTVLAEPKSSLLNGQSGTSATLRLGTPLDDMDICEDGYVNSSVAVAMSNGKLWGECADPPAAIAENLKEAGVKDVEVDGYVNASVALALATARKWDGTEEDNCMTSESAEESRVIASVATAMTSRRLAGNAEAPSASIDKSSININDDDGALSSDVHDYVNAAAITAITDGVNTPTHIPTENLPQEVHITSSANIGQDANRADDTSEDVDPGRAALLKKFQGEVQDLGEDFEI